MTTTTNWIRERHTIPNPAAEARAGVLATLSREAAAWGFFVRERTGQDGPLSCRGTRFRYVGGRRGGEAEFGFDTLPAVARWVEASSHPL